MSVKRSCTGFKDGRCRFNPLKKCKYAISENDSYSKASAFSVISVYYKLKDDLTDSKFFKKLLVRMVMPFFSHWHKMAAKKYPDIEKYAFEMMELQHSAENSNEISLDKSAHPTAHMLANVFALEAEDEMQKRVFYEFGYHLGRWIYLIDAADDYEKDKKSGNFNPFLKVNTDCDMKDYMTAVLNQSLARAYDAYNLIEITDFKGILDNMMLLGFPATQNRVINKTTEGKNEQSI